MHADRFNRICRIIALLFLVTTIGAKTAWYEYRGLPQTQDYPQYYMGGLIARLGEWDSLYPIPNPHSVTNPGAVGNSELRPKYRQLANDTGVSEYAVRYMQPPPFALLLIPLSFFSFKVSFYLWVVLLVLAAWGIALQAGRIFELSLGRTTRLAGAVVLLVAVSPQAHRWVRVGNMSVILGWMLGYAMLELVRRDSARGAVVMVIGTVAKYAPAVLAPVYIVMRRWRTIAWGVGLLVAWLGVSYLVMGPGPFKVFFGEISPTLSRTSSIGENQALYPTLMRMLGIEEPPLPRGLEISFNIARLAMLALILALIFLKPRRYWDEPPHVFAGCLALISWLLIFSPICWEHYHAYLAPLWGWLAYQATRSWPRLIVAVLAIGFAYLPTSLLFHQVFGNRFLLPEPLFSHLFMSVMIQLLMALWVLGEWHVRHSYRLATTARPGLFGG
jgi:hypothetical protein